MNDNIMYVGIDVSKDKHDICIKNNTGNVLKQFQIRNNKRDLDKLYTTVNKLKSNREDDIVFFGMEATGIYSLPLYSALKRDGHLVKQYNPIQTNGYRKIKIRKTKTDSIDSAIIADMLRYQEQPVPTAIDNLKLYQLRELCRVRQRNIEKRTKCKIQLVRNLDTVWPGYQSMMKSVYGKTSIALLKKYPVPSKVAAEPFGDIYEMIKQVSRSQMSKTRVEEIYNHAENTLEVPEIDSIISIEIKTLISEIELYDGQIKALDKMIGKLMKPIGSKITTIPGIGNILGAMILGEIGSIDKFSSAKKLVAFAGLDPITNQSGKFENKTGHISKRGSPQLRSALFMAANVARQKDENFKEYYDDKIERGKHYSSAVNATAAKLLRIVYWVLKNDKEYKVK
ncbi:MAG: IS110 family transposase [Deltaproteobacteria bacterium]|nr:IS110 family transposase [Deltaproteobacteria bacterium]